MGDAAKQETSLWFRGDEDAGQIRQRILQHGQTVENLHLTKSDFFTKENLAGLKLPRLRDLILGNLNCLDHDPGWEWLSGMPSLRRFVAGTTYISDAILQRLAAAPWWEQLTLFDISILHLNQTTLWPSLWTGRTLPLELLSVFYLDNDSATEMLKACMPKLEYLVVGSELGEAFLGALAQTSLPSLVDLDLWHSAVSKDAFLRFVQGERPGLPRLKRLGKNYASDRRQEYYDWNGAPVDWGYELMSPGEFKSHYLSGTGLDLLPENFDLAIRFQNHFASPLRMLRRPADTA